MSAASIAPEAAGRRRFLLASAATLSVGFLAGCALPVIPKRPAPGLDDASGWIRFDGERYTLVIPRVEMGQNIATALKQIACAELGIPMDSLAVELHSTRSIRRVRASVGSESVKDFAVPLAQACATLRDAVAAGLKPGAIQARERPLAELRSLQKGAPLIGRSVPIEQGRAIVTGQPLFAGDVRRPGMRFGRVLRAPASPELGSRAVRMDETAARAVPGFVQLVRDERLLLGLSQGVGIVAATPGALQAIEQALKIEWAVDADRKLTIKPD